MPKETIQEVMDGREPKLLMDIHDESEVNNPNIHLSEIDGRRVRGILRMQGSISSAMVKARNGD